MTKRHFPTGKCMNREKKQTSIPKQLGQLSASCRPQREQTRSLRPLLYGVRGRALGTPRDRRARLGARAALPAPAGSAAFISLARDWEICCDSSPSPSPLPPRHSTHQRPGAARHAAGEHRACLGAAAGSACRRAPGAFKTRCHKLFVLT